MTHTFVILFIIIPSFCYTTVLLVDIVTMEFRAIIENKRLLQAIAMAGKLATSELENFHSDINRNAPKMEGFSYSGMLSR